MSPKDHPLSEGNESCNSSSALQEFKRRLVKVLVRSRLNYSDNLFEIRKFFINLRWERGWSASELAQEWRTLLRETSAPRHLFTLYLHFPYCKSRCSYCHTNSRVICGQGPMERYIEEMQEEVRFFAPIFEGIPFNSFAVGGGTPSLMTATQLKRFCGSALDAFQLPEEGLRSVELHPATTDGSKLRALRELGFKRVSFGVQSMTPETLRRINRRQSFAAVQAAIHGAKTAGFEVVNADMIFGFVGEPLESFLKSFRQVAAIHPTEITVTILSPTEKYMKATRTTQETYRRYYDDNLMPAFEGVMGIARRMGYQMPANADPKNREWLVVDPACPLDRNTYCQETGRRMASMLGLGRGSRSWIFGRRAYERDWEKFSPKAAIFQVASMSLKEEMAIFILQQLESGSRLAYVDFQERFGLDVREMFPSELKILKAFGQISLDAESFHYLPRGVHHRVFWATVFALDAFPSLPCAAGLFDGDLRARLEDELVGVDLCLSAA